MRAGQLAPQGAQIVSMLAALHQKQLVFCMEAVQLAGSGDVLPAHMGATKPVSRAEQARQCQARRWAAVQIHQQLVQQVRQPAPESTYGNGESHKAQAASRPQQLQAASPGASEEGQGAVNLPGQGSNPPWQEWKGEMKTITSEGDVLCTSISDALQLHCNAHEA